MLLLLEQVLLENHLMLRGQLLKATWPTGKVDQILDDLLLGSSSHGCCLLLLLKIEKLIVLTHRWIHQCLSPCVTT
jgi:hypothetical protein